MVWPSQHGTDNLCSVCLAAQAPTVEDASQEYPNLDDLEGESAVLSLLCICRDCDRQGKA